MEEQGHSLPGQGWRAGTAGDKAGMGAVTTAGQESAYGARWGWSTALQIIAMQ